VGGLVYLNDRNQPNLPFQELYHTFASPMCPYIAAKVIDFNFGSTYLESNTWLGGYV
jgi:hypothetical protein